MDFDALAEELAVRVVAALSDRTGSPLPEIPQVPLPPASGCGCKPRLAQSHKPVLLLLPQEKDPAGMPKPGESGLDKPLLESKFDLLCARNIAYEPDWDQIDGVVAFGLTTEALGKISTGIIDSCYTKAMSQAILRGKSIYILRNQVELFQYEKTAPVSYFMKLREHLTLLERSGLTVGNGGRLEAVILNGNQEVPVPVSRPAVTDGQETLADESVIVKHLVTEQDIASVNSRGIRQITIGSRAILTDLAKDLAQKQNITIIRG